MSPFVQDIKSFVLLDADGEEHRCSRDENAKLFRLVCRAEACFA